MRREKQMAKVIAALQDGCNTAPEIAEATGVTRSNCSCYLTKLARWGVVRDSGRRLQRTGVTGPKPIVYELIA